MSDLETFARVADLLATPEREKFLSAVARFRNVPEDDEYLQILEAIGFMTLIWSKVPAEVHSVLEGCKPTEVSVDFLRSQLREILKECIPSYTDLQRTLDAIRTVQAVQTRRGSDKIGQQPPSLLKVTNLLIGFLAGFAATNLLQALLLR